MNLASLLHTSASRHPDAPALAIGTEVLATYSDHADCSSRLASALLSLPGIEAGDRVAIAMKNCREYSEIIFGAWHAGLSIVPINF